MNNLESAGYDNIMDEVRTFHDPHDPWGSNIAWLFALADYMWLINGKVMPGYRPSPLASLEDCSSELETLMDIRDECPWEDADVERVYTILSRYDDWLRLAGKNY